MDATVVVERIIIFFFEFFFWFKYYHYCYSYLCRHLWPDCCGQNITRVPLLQSPDITITTMATVYKAKVSVIEHIKAFDRAMLALLSLVYPDLQTELDPETSTTSWAFAISIIPSMRRDIDPDHVKQKQDFCGNNFSRKLKTLCRHWSVYWIDSLCLFVSKLCPSLSC